MSVEHDFTGRAIAVWVRDPAKGCVLENACVRSLNDRSFIVGRLPHHGTDSDPRVGLTFWFPLDDVLMITEYPDVEAAHKAYAARETLQQRGWFRR